MLHEKFGSKPMTQILAPSIEYARKGFPVSELIAYYLDRSVARIGSYDGFKETYMPNGKMPQKGEIFKNPFLATTYEKSLPVAVMRFTKAILLVPSPRI